MVHKYFFYIMTILLSKIYVVKKCKPNSVLYRVFSGEKGYLANTDCTQKANSPSKNFQKKEVTVTSDQVDVYFS